MSDMDRFETWWQNLPKVGIDWTEDFEHENGSYQNQCTRCNAIFRGHKRRVMCKACDPSKVEQPLKSSELKAICNDVMRWQGKQQKTIADECIKSFDCANGDHSDACPVATQRKPEPHELPHH